MHELALAQGIINTIVEISKQNSIKKVSLVEISVGQMSQIDVDVLKFWLKELSKGTPVEGADFRLSVEETKYRCRTCSHEWRWKDIEKDILRMFCGEEECDNPLHFIPELASVFIRCPKCGSPDFEIIGGTGVKIMRIVGGRD